MGYPILGYSVESKVFKMFDNLLSEKTDLRFPWVPAISLYLASFGLQFFFLPARFWDDWITNALYTGNETKRYWDEVGFLPIYGILQSDILQNSAAAIRILQLVLYFAGGILFFLIIKSLRIPQWFATTATLTFLIAPINSARVSISMINYAVSLFLFLSGWAILVKSQTRWSALLSLPFFFVGFSTLTLLPFFLLPAVHSAYLELCERGNAPKALARFCSLLILPLLYWFIWRRIDPPIGADLVAYFTPSASGIVRSGLLVGLSLVATAAVLRRRQVLGDEFPRFFMLSIGLVALTLGASGYVASGRLVDLSEWMLNFVPESSEWDSRHQLLLGIGFAVGFAALVGQPLSRLRKLMLLAAFGSMVALNFTFMQAYMLDFQKQQQVITQLSNFPEILDWTEIRIRDEAEIFNARGRNYRSYEMQGMVKEAFSLSSVDAMQFQFSIDAECGNDSRPQGEIGISASAGRLRALLTNDSQISLKAISDPCRSSTTISN